MYIHFLILTISLAIILFSCELFTNAVECIGHRFKLGDGIVGSILSAVGTCLPETLVPTVSIVFSHNIKKFDDIGIGAIVGAPFMLSTLAFFITGISVIAFYKSRRTGMKININNEIISRDVAFFIILYISGISATFINSIYIKNFIAGFLILGYIFYIYLTLKYDEHSKTLTSPLYFQMLFNAKNRFLLNIIQIMFALSGIFFAAELFVKNIKYISDFFAISAVTLSLIITPIATELPEKFNSILWIKKKRDTLALGNITGALVFQSCIPVSIGILLTPWKLNNEALLSAVLAIISATLILAWIKLKRSLTPMPFIFGGAFYMIFLFFTWFL